MNPENIERLFKQVKDLRIRGFSITDIVTKLNIYPHNIITYWVHKIDKERKKCSKQ